MQTTIFDICLYGSKNLSPTLKEGHKLDVSENRTLWIILGPKGEWPEKMA